MNALAGGGGIVRRARPALGTLVEIGVHALASDADARVAIDAAFAEIATLQSQLSRFDPASDVARFHALPVGGTFVPHESTQAVLGAASALHEASGGLFDISAGSAPRGWALADDGRIVKHDERVRIDLGGIAKGYVVDRAVECLLACGVHAGWVNAGGDLRAFGDVELPIVLRDESRGGGRAFARLADGAFATSRYGRGARSQLAGRGARGERHVSVAAPLCLWADALTKVVALSGDVAHPLLARHGAQAWLH